MNNNIDNISKKNIEKLISYFSRNLKMKNLMHSDVIQLIYDYQRVVLYYQLPNIPVHHPCVQAFKLDLCENQILIQVASLFFIFDTKTCKYEAVCRLFKDIQQDYGYHVIHIPQQNKLYLFHGNTETVSVQELIYNEKCKLIGSKHCLKMYSKTMFGLRSIVLNDEYFLIFCNGIDGNTKVTVYNYIINNDITLPLLDMSNNFKFKSCGLVLLKKNEFLVFGNDAMYEIKVTFLRNMYAFNIFPQFDIKKIDNELFKDDFILHEFGYALCDKYILIFGGNYSNDSANPIFSDDIYIYNVKTNRWFKSKIKLPFLFNVKNNNILFDYQTRMIHLIGANEYVDRRYEPNDINPSSLCHLKFDVDVLIDQQNMEPYIYENKQSTKTDYSRCMVVFV